MTFFDDAHDRLARYFGDSQWDIYDGVPVQHHAHLTVNEMLVSVALNPQRDRRDKIWYVWKQKVVVEMA